MNKLFCLLGETSCGKDTIFKEVLKLAQQENLNIRQLISNTNRPRREYEKQNVDYNFVTMHQFDIDYKNEKIAEYNVYRIDSINQTWVYYTKKDDIKLDECNMLKIVNPLGYCQLKSQYENNIVSIHITCPREIRRQRYIKRNATIDNVDDRMARDEKDFQHLVTDYEVLNDGSRSVEEVAKEVLEIIKEEMM